MKKHLLFLFCNLFLLSFGFKSFGQETPTPPPPCGLGYVLVACDEADNDGFTQFDLSDINALNYAFCPVGVASLSNISYHISEEDADNNINAISNFTTYTNISNPQTIYVRAIYSGNATVSSYPIQVLGDPVENAVADLIGCDDDADGFTEFILNSQNGGITEGLICTTVSYYESLLDAENATNPIDGSVPYINVNNPQSIYFREENEATGNFVTGSFNIIAQLPPVIYNPTALEICDDNYDGISSFNLISKNTEITGGNASLSVSYFETATDAQADTNVISPSYAYQNIANPQTLYVRVEDNTSGCVEFTTLAIRVEPIPSPQTPTAIALCDDPDNDGIEFFDLTIRETEILNGETNVSATYHESLDDAEAGVNAISDPTMYANLAYNQDIYVRITHDNTGCFKVVVLELKLSYQPNIDYAISVLESCQDDNSNEEMAYFNLNALTSEILGGLDSGFFTVTYYDTLNDAENEVNSITEANNYYSGSKTIYARLTSDVFEVDCYDVTQFDIVVNPLPNISLENSYDLCNGETLILDSGLNEGYNFSWNTGEFTPSIIVDLEGTYIVTVVDLSSGCTIVNSTIVNSIDCTDTDDDGVIDDDEDENDNGDLDDDDTDDDGIANYLDDDDDGDNVPTSIEINISTGRASNFQHPFVDADGDLIENYLDDDDDGDGVLTVNEDYNNNGDPTDDDVNMNGLADYLDSGVTLSLEDLNQISFNVYPNPADEFVSISFSNMSNELANIRILDLQGKMIVDEVKPFENSKINLDVSSLQSGIYFIQLFINEVIVVRKLIID